MYSIADYGAMIADRVRMDGFARALRQAVEPGSIVIDIGTGTGIFALLACRFGAKRVYAIEPADAIQIAREIAKANGCADRIEFIQAKSTDVTLPERADVIVSDIGGILPWFQHHIPSIVDARHRLLAAGGVLIPRQDTVWAAVVDAPELYARRTGPWRENVFGLDMEAARSIVVNTIGKGGVTREQLLTPTARWATLDYTRIEDHDIRARLTWTTERPGLGHGFVAGFDRLVGDGLTLSNAPDAPDDIRPRGIYGTLFFPWRDAVHLAPGDSVTVDLDATLVGADYVWSWATHVEEQGTRAEKASFTQSTFFGAPLTPAQLKKRSVGYRPQLNADGHVTRFILDAMSRGVPVGEIARRVSAEFSNRFPNPGSTLALVADLSQQYG
jgi:protein arginine N-methyltransferase 1